MEIRQNAKVASYVVPAFLLLFYVIPFVIVGVLLTGEDFWLGIGREVTWGLFFVPSLWLPYFYGYRGTRIIGFSSGALALALILLLLTSQQANTIWVHGLFVLTVSLFVGYCVGLLTERIHKSKIALGEQHKLLKSLYEASQLHVLDSKDVLNKSLKIVRESLGFDYAEIWLLEDESTLRRAASNLPPECTSLPACPADFCLPGLALSSGESVYIEDSLNDDRRWDKTWANCFGHASEAAMPLIYQGEKLGVVIIANREPYVFTPVSRELLQIFVNQLALSIKNASLYTEMEQKALVDERTGLFNHRYFHNALDNEIKRAGREHTQVSLLMLDLDYFKEYNDTFGHPEGDKLLLEFGAVLKEAVRDSDIAARYGGDEFVIILPNTDEEGAIHLAARIAERVENHTFPGYEKMPGGRMSVSVGCATYPSPAKNKVELVKLADDHMYETKVARRESRKANTL